MMYPSLPPLRTLKAFESSARHLSFTRAAEELHLTQAAISHQIKQLEQRVGVRLFRRGSRSLFLTEEGQVYLPTVREALETLNKATEQLTRLKSQSGVISVSVLPSFATKWLVPRLYRFQEIYPDLDVRVSAFEWLVDFTREDVDLAVRYGRGSWSGLRADPLLTEDVFPVCSPKLLKEKPLDKPADLANHTLLHDDFSREDWKLWLMAAGVDNVDPSRGLSFSHTSIMLEAAEGGHGVALGRTPLVRSDLKTGVLVKPFEISLHGDFAYYVVCREDRADETKIAAFRDWLLDEAKQEDREVSELPTD